MTRESHTIACWGCKGRGIDRKEFPAHGAPYPCPRCNGTGLVTIVARSEDIPTLVRVPEENDDGDDN